MTKTGINSFSIWTAGSTVNDPLPVSLTFFNANCAESGGALLSWETASEYGSEYFEVEKSEDGQEWSSVAQVDAAGNSESTLQYEWNDFENRGRLAYYRLSQIDISGEVQVFPIVTAQCAQDESWAVKAFPNPTEQLINLQISGSESNEDAIYSIVDMGGKELSHGTFAVGRTESIDLSTYPTGMYLVKIAQDGHSDIVKVVKE